MRPIRAGVYQGEVSTRTVEVRSPLVLDRAVHDAHVICTRCWALAPSTLISGLRRSGELQSARHRENRTHLDYAQVRSWAPPVFRRFSFSAADGRICPTFAIRSHPARARVRRPPAQQTRRGAAEGAFWSAWTALHNAHAEYGGESKHGGRLRTLGSERT